jgi:hypothetical protein
MHIIFISVCHVWILFQLILTVVMDKGEAGIKCHTRGHSHNCGVGVDCIWNGWD